MPRRWNKTRAIKSLVETQEAVNILEWHYSRVFIEVHWLNWIFDKPKNNYHHHDDNNNIFMMKNILKNITKAIMYYPLPIYMIKYYLFILFYYYFFFILYIPFINLQFYIQRPQDIAGLPAKYACAFKGGKLEGLTSTFYILYINILLYKKKLNICV